VADPFVDKEFGTGAVKVTPAHDANDFDAGKRCGLPSLLVMNKDGTMNEAAGEDFRGLDRFEAREKILKQLEERGFLEKTEDYEHIVKHCGRCDTVIEPYLSTQWFVKAKPLAERAVEAVENGRTKVVPEKWKKTYFEWLRNIHDWCISRQIWWGHPVPAWHCACGEFLVAGEKPASACAKCGKGDWTPDPDVLDTWFSSQLWPFSTLGWPDETRDLKTYYPTTLLITGFDILFFWVARMMMAGLHFMKDVPFREVYIHGLVRDAKGHKMSKSRGNTVDPLDFIEKYGADSLRFTFLAMATPGMDVPLNEQRVVGYRAFCTKLWNAVRFVLMNLDEDAAVQKDAPSSLPERWLLSRLARTVEEVNASFADYRFDHAANELYHFLWGDFCDWFVEISKPALSGGDAEAKRSAQSTLLLVLDRVLRLLHPFMPFITEELWQKLPASVRDAESLCVAAWPQANKSWFDEKATDAMDGVKSVVTEIRSVRALLQVDPKEKIEIAVLKNDTSEERLSTHGAMISNLARLKACRLVQTLPQKGIPVRAWGLKMCILREDVEHSAVRARLEKNLADVSKQHKALATKLENPLFVKRAPDEVVMDTRVRQSALEKKIPRIKEIIEALR
jgi:valyl-tRNA synthetase